MVADRTTSGASWVGACVRALLPTRLLLSAGTVAAITLLSSLLLAQLTEQPLRLDLWAQQPLQQWQLLGEALFAQGAIRALVRVLLALSVLSMATSLAACWIARAELLAQQKTGPEGGMKLFRADPTTLTFARARNLFPLLPMCLLILGGLLLPGTLLGIFNHVPLLGPFLLAVSFPVLLLLGLLATVLFVGLVAYSFMPCAVAAEGSDQFDALSRGYSYCFQRPLLFLRLELVVLGLSALPLLAGLSLVPVPLLAIVSLSIFWSLQPLVYVQLREVVDNTPWYELWDGPLTATPESNPAPVAEADPAEAPTPPARPQFERVTLSQVMQLSSAPRPNQQMLVLGVGLWSLLALLLPTLYVWQNAAPPGAPFGLASLREAVRDRAQQEPATLGVLVGLAVLLGTFGGWSTQRIVARLAAIQFVYGRSCSLHAIHEFARNTRGQGFLSALFFTAGLQTFSVTLFLGLLLLREATPWEEVAALAGLSAALLGLGAFGLGWLAVKGTQVTDWTDPQDVLPESGQGTLILLSVVPSVLRCAYLLVVYFLIAWSSWYLASESLSWLGGDRAQWAQWARTLDVVPVVQPGLAQLACWIAGFWFVFWFGMVMVYPACYALRWAAACHLLGQSWEPVPGDPLRLTAAEQEELNRPRRRPFQGQSQSRG